MAGNVSSVYINVIDDVVSKVREEFINSGAGEALLNELQALWEAKMMQSGVISGNIERQLIQRPAGPAAQVHDLNVPYEGPIEEYETPTADMLFPPTPLQTPMQTPLPQTPMPGTVDYNIPTGPSDFTGTPVNDTRNDMDIKVGRPSPYMQAPSPWMNQRPLGVDVNVAYDEGRDELERGASHQPLTQDLFMMSSGKRKRDEYQLTSGPYMPQQDGSGDITIEFLLPEANGVQNSGGKGQETAIAGKEATAGSVLPQQDGIHDEYDNLFPYGRVATEDYNAVNTPVDHVELQVGTPSVGTPMPTKGEAVDDDEPPLNEDDDDEDDLDELERGEEEPHTQHLVLAQFDKVTRTKSRWKCALKDGIMHLNGRDILFNKMSSFPIYPRLDNNHLIRNPCTKATGEFDF